MNEVLVQFDYATEAKAVKMLKLISKTFLANAIDITPTLAVSLTNSICVEFAMERQDEAKVIGLLLASGFGEPKMYVPTYTELLS